MQKVFIPYINSPLGRSIYEEIRNDHLPQQSPISILATLDPTDGTDRPEGLYDLINVLPI